MSYAGEEGTFESRGLDARGAKGKVSSELCFSPGFPLSDFHDPEGASLSFCYSGTSSETLKLRK